MWEKLSSQETEKLNLELNSYLACDRGAQQLLKFSIKCLKIHIVNNEVEIMSQRQPTKIYGHVSSAILGLTMKLETAPRRQSIKGNQRFVLVIILKIIFSV